MTCYIVACDQVIPPFAEWRVFLDRLEGGNPAETRSEIADSADHFESGVDPTRHESSRLGLASATRRSEGALVYECQRQLAADLCVREAGAMAMMHNAARPGELLKEFLGDRTATELAAHIGVARATISRILNGRNAITVDLSIRLGEALGLSPDFFSKAQLQYDLWIESRKKRPKIKPLAA